jgi:hypothetical protein
VDVRGEQFLSGAGFADQEHAGVGARDQRGLLEDGFEDRARADHPGAFADQLAETLVLLPES